MIVPTYRMVTVTWLVLQVLAIAVTWSILLFAGNPPEIGWRDNLDYVISDDSGMRVVFIGSIVAMLVAMALIGGYLSPRSDDSKALWILFALSLFNAVPALIWLNVSSAIPFLAASLFGALAAREAAHAGHAKRSTTRLEG